MAKYDFKTKQQYCKIQTPFNPYDSHCLWTYNHFSFSLMQSQLQSQMQGTDFIRFRFILTKRGDLVQRKHFQEVLMVSIAYEELFQSLNGDLIKCTWFHIALHIQLLRENTPRALARAFQTETSCTEDGRIRGASLGQACARHGNQRWGPCRRVFMMPQECQQLWAPSDDHHRAPA